MEEHWGIILSKNDKKSSNELLGIWKIPTVLVTMIRQKETHFHNQWSQFLHSWNRDKCHEAVERISAPEIESQHLDSETPLSGRIKKELIIWEPNYSSVREFCLIVPGSSSGRCSFGQMLSLHWVGYLWQSVHQLEIPNHHTSWTNFDFTFDKEKYGHMNKPLQS